ncbi:diguanylate cyclase [Kribbella flavida DSM 17836]|uniref:Diguanylate cyclase n=1 Tax=Kribbella flavida (strain DSM 17836 / JCM 10339 / NBRC 14399) TaxID=479435 RepID=D2PTE2_KRIFD|nr:GGDEF domain-containing protein [Kribbella flavida]ADB29458.1 diguanylate cyclase [Kribbella flavida DSM 17836]
MVAQSRRAVWNWALWTLTVPAFGLVVLVDLLAIGYGVRAFAELPSWRGLDLVFALTVSALVAVEGARRVENRRNRGGALHKDLAPAWMIAAALVLHPALAILVAVLLRIWWRIRAGKCIPYRWAFSTAVHVLGVGAAHAVFTGAREMTGDASFGLVAAMAAAAFAYVATETLLCGLAISLIVPGSGRRDTIGGKDDLWVDATAATFGCLLAAAALVSPWFAFLAVPISLTAQRALLLGQLESEVQTDPKTKLGRVDWWRQRTEEMLRTARTQREPMAVLLIDIDHFKQVNDRHGHLVGDEALRAVATILRSAIRAKDVIGRFGGEEFVIALPDTDGTDAAVTADRLRSAVAASPLAAMCAGVLDDPELDPDTFHLTVSVGVAVYPSDGHTVDELLRRADRAMYAAKAAGRDRVRLAADAAPTGLAHLTLPPAPAMPAVPPLRPAIPADPVGQLSSVERVGPTVRPR